MDVKTTELMSVPDPDEFTKLIHQHVKCIEKQTRRILNQSKIIKKAGLCNLSNDEIFSIIRPYLIEVKKYRIYIGAYGSICIEAPTKKECLELFKEVTRTMCDSKIAKQ
jgi:hypothetical protein